MDFVVCGMQRSGSTLLYNILRNIIEIKNLNIDQVGFVSRIESYDTVNRLIKIHLYQDLNLDPLNFYFYSYRRLDEVCESLMEMNNWSFQKVLNEKLPNIVDYDIWIKNHPNYNKYVVDYSQLIHSLFKTISDISKFLNTTITDGEIQEIQESVSKNNVFLPKSKFNKNTLYHYNHFSAGKVKLNEEQRKLIYQKFNKWFYQNNFEFI